MENQRANDEIEIDLLEVLGVLLRKSWLIIGLGVLGALLCFVLSRFVLTPVYESTTKIYILNKNESSAVTYSDVQMGTQLTKDYAELISSRYVLEKVSLELNLPFDYRELLHKVTVITPTDTRIVSITVEDTNPEQAMNIANRIREVAGEHIQNVMDIEAVNVVETANMPTEKSGPSVVKWTLAGGFAGCFLMGLIILIQYLLDDTIKTAEDVERYLGLSTLALIPAAMEESDGKKKRKSRRGRK